MEYQDTPLFKSSHAALIFAFHYAGQQSPKTPMGKMLGGASLGNGKGLSGLDGAAQAGMILSEFDKLDKHQRLVLLIRFGDVRHTCTCCGQLAPSDEWLEAVDALSWAIGLEGYPRIVRHAMIERAVCRKKWDAKRVSEDHGIALRTLHRQIRDIKERIGKLETKGLNQLYDMLAEQGVCGDD